MQRFQLRPRFGGIAWSALGVGTAVAGLAAVAAVLPVMAIGAVGAVLGFTYLRSPTWRLYVTVDDDALAVRGPAGDKFRLPWTEVVKVIVAERKATCFVDGGAPARSLLVPGDGAPAPYDIADRAALVAAILRHTNPELIERVETFEGLTTAQKPA